MVNGQTILVTSHGSEVSSKGDLQDPIDGGTLVPYVWPYFAGDIPLHRPEK